MNAVVAEPVVAVTKLEELPLHHGESRGFCARSVSRADVKKARCSCSAAPPPPHMCARAQAKTPSVTARDSARESVSFIAPGCLGRPAAVP